MARRRAEPETPVTPEPVVEPVATPEEVPVEVVPEPEPVVEVPEPAPEVVPEPPARIVTAKWEGMTLVNVKSGTVLGRLSPLAVAHVGGGAVTPIWFAGQMEVMGPASSVDKGREWLTEQATRVGWVVA